jgi:hypothetical protein
MQPHGVLGSLQLGHHKSRVFRFEICVPEQPEQRSMQAVEFGDSS